MGSHNPTLGIPITYAEIYNARALIEIADDEHAPEPSYGTHFFQDLIEARIYPLALALQDPDAEFNRSFFEESANILGDLLPDEKSWERFVKVIDVYVESQNRHIELVIDSEAGEAIAYLRQQSPN